MKELTAADEFDAEWAEVPVAPHRASGMAPGAARELIVRPKVARALIHGVPVRVLAARLGVSPATIVKHMRTMPMADLMQIEANRVLRHLSGRSLAKEKYRDLVAGLEKLVVNMRLLRNEPTEIPGNITTTTIQRISIGLFGRGGSPGRTTIDRDSADDESIEVRVVHGETEERGQG